MVICYLSNMGSCSEWLVSHVIQLWMGNVRCPADKTKIMLWLKILLNSHIWLPVTCQISVHGMCQMMEDNDKAVVWLKSNPQQSATVREDMVHPGSLFSLPRHWQGESNLVTYCKDDMWNLGLCLVSHVLLTLPRQCHESNVLYNCHLLL